MREQIQKFRLHWKNYVFQSAFAGLAMFVLLTVITIERAPIIITSMGATAFIVFAMPKCVMAKERNVIGGHTIGIFTGSLFSLIPAVSLPVSILLYSAAVGVSIFLMVVLDMEHPPASGTALAFAIAGFSLAAFIAVMSCVMVLAMLHYLLRNKLKDLT
jgi:CBS-domain-containing membrane protein